MVVCKAGQGNIWKNILRKIDFWHLNCLSSQFSPASTKVMQIQCINNGVASFLYWASWDRYRARINSFRSIQFQFKLDSGFFNSIQIGFRIFQFNSNSIHFLSIPIQFNSDFMHRNKQINQIIGYFKFNLNISLFAAQFRKYIIQDHNNSRINKSALVQVLG